MVVVVAVVVQEVEGGAAAAVSEVDEVVVVGGDSSSWSNGLDGGSAKYNKGKAIVFLCAAQRLVGLATGGEEGFLSHFKSCIHGTNVMALWIKKL